MPDIRIIIRSNPGKAKSTVIALIEGMLLDQGFKNIAVEDDDTSFNDRYRLRHDLVRLERDIILNLHIAVEHQQTARTEET